MNFYPPSRLRGVLAFTAAYTALASLLAVVSGKWEFTGYLIVQVSVTACLAAVDRRCPIVPGLLWTFSLWGLFHMAGGFVPVPSGWFGEGEHPVLYNWWLIPGLLRYDQVVHAYGFGITTWLCWHVVSSCFRASDGARIQPGLGVLVLCMAASMGFGAFNELVEFIMTRIFPDTNVGGYSNLGWDLVANFLGAVVCALLIRKGWRPVRQIPADGN